MAYSGETLRGLTFGEELEAVQRQISNTHRRIKRLLPEIEHPGQHGKLHRDLWQR
ncbi:MAG: hypothetical protein GDA41_08070 [Rhodospirillales bacterium]|nr:hypothetical protein [Rhodospirillales bacterium]